MKCKINKYLQIITLLLTALVYTPSLEGDFLNWDDTTYISDNELLSEDIGTDSFKKIYHYDSYISLTLFSFQLQNKIFGNSTFYYHLINILIHLINVFLVFYITKILFKNNTASFWIALLFAIHPYNAESVAWIMQRKDLLYTMFFLLGTISYIKFIKTDKILLYLISIILAYLAIISKISAITLVLTLLLVEFYLNKKITIKSLLLLFIIGLAQLSNISSFSFFFIYTAIPLIIIRIHNKLHKGQLLEKESYSRSNIIRYKINSLLSNNKTIVFLIVAYSIIFIISTIYAYSKGTIIKHKYRLSIEFVVYAITYLLPILILFLLNDKNQERITKFIAFFKSPRKIIIIVIVFLTLALPFIYFEVLTKFEPGEFILTNVISLKTLLYFAYSLMFYIIGFIFPFYQNSMYPYPDGEQFSLLFKIAPFVLIVVSFLTFYLIKKIKDKTLQRRTIFGILFFLINISIVLHIIPIRGRIIVAERYSYLPYLGLIIVFVFILKQLTHQIKLPQKRIVMFFVILLVGAYSIQSYSRSKVFKNSFTFWSDVINKKPNNHYAIYALGLHYYEKSDYATAINYYSTAININPANYEYYLNRGSSYFKIDSIDLAINDYDKSIALNPDNTLAFKNRGILYYETGKIEKATSDLEVCIKLNPNDNEITELYDNANKILSEYENYQNSGKSSSIVSQYYFKLATNLATKGEYKQSILFYDESIKFDSLNIDAFKNRGNVFAMLKRFEESINDYNKALRIDTSNASIYLNLGNILHQSGNLKLACDNWQKALVLGNTNAQKMLDKYCK